MKYVCLVYFEHDLWEQKSPADVERMREENRLHDRALEHSGLGVAQPLQSVQTAVTLRVRDGQVTTQDGPFAETKEVLGGFVIVEAPDLNGALLLAARIPLARYGSIEVRPALEI